MYNRPKGAGGFRSPAPEQLAEVNASMERQSLYHRLALFLNNLAAMALGKPKSKILGFVNLIRHQL